MLSEILSLLKEIRTEQKLQRKDIQKLVKRIDKIERRKATVSEKNDSKHTQTAKKIFQTLKPFSGLTPVEFFTEEKLHILSKNDYRLQRHFVLFVHKFAEENHSIRQKGARVYLFNGKSYEAVPNKPAFWRQLRTDLIENFLQNFKRSVLSGEQREYHEYDDDVCWEPHHRSAYKEYMLCRNEFCTKTKIMFLKSSFATHGNGTLIDQLRKLC